MHRFLSAVRLFSRLRFLLLYAMWRAQCHLTLNPQGFAGLKPSLAFNTTVSFVTNTNWQSYGGETTMSYFSQMAGLTVQNFLSAAVGISVAIALIRGIASRSGNSIGNFWQDLIRTVLYVLLPISIVLALVLVFQGSIQTFAAYFTVHGITGLTQTIAVAPAAGAAAAKARPCALAPASATNASPVRTALLFEVSPVTMASSATSCTTASTPRGNPDSGRAAPPGRGP